MSIADLYSDDIEAGIQRQIANPTPTPGASFSTRSFLAAGMKGIRAAAADVAAGVSDLTTASGGDTAFASLDTGPQADAASKQMREGQRNDSTVGNELRANVATNAPDAATATTADQVLYGLTRMGTKVAAALSVANAPLAAGMLMGEGTNTAYHELVAKGIDPATALKVGAVQGAGQAAAVIPFAGPTILSTLGLAAAAGPGTFMAQEALSRKILADAGAKDEASLHDPLDPLGLTIATLLPAIFAGVHVAGLARSAKPAPTLESVVQSMESNGKRYGPDGKILEGPMTKSGTAKGEMQVVDSTNLDPGFGVRPADMSGTPEQQAAERARVGSDYLAAMQNRYGTPDMAMAAYNAGPGTLDKAIAAHGADWLAHMPQETRDYVSNGMKKLGDQTMDHASSDPATIDAARVRVTQDALHRSMPDDIEAPAAVAKATDDLAAGEQPNVPPLDSSHFSPDDVLPSGLLDETRSLLAEHPKAERSVLLTDEQSATAAKELEPSIAKATEAKPAFDDTLERMSNELGAKGFMTASVKGGARLLEKHVIDNQSNPANMRDLVRGSLVVDKVSDVPAALAKIRENYEITKTDSGKERIKDRFASPTPSGYRDMLVNVKLPNGGEGEIQIHIPEMISAKKVGHKVYDIERDMGADHPDQAKLQKLRDLQGRVYAAALDTNMARTSASKASLDSGVPYANTLARLGKGREPDGPNASQAPEGNSTTGMPSTSKNFEPAGNDGNSISTSDSILGPTKGKREPPPFDTSRVAALAKESPDMPVQLPGSDKTVTVAEALQQAKDEHAFEVSESSLVQAALDCVLSFGA